MVDNKNKTYLERLTFNQIVDFFERYFPIVDGYSVDFNRNQTIIYGSIKGMYETTINFAFHDYGALEGNYKKEWVKYLYEMFGEEYKQAYLRHCSSIFD